MRTSRLLLLLPLVLSCSPKLAEEGTTPGSCSDNADNDEDTLFDCEDPGCATAPECTDDGDEGGGTGGTGDGGGTGGTGGGEGAGEGGGTGGEEGGGTGGEEGGGTGGTTGDDFELVGTVTLTVENLDTGEQDTCTGPASGTYYQADPFFALSLDCEGFTGFGRYLGLGAGGLEGEVSDEDNSITGVVLWQFMSDTVWTGTWSAPQMTGSWSGSFAEGAVPVGYSGTIQLEDPDWGGGGEGGEEDGGGEGGEGGEEGGGGEGGEGGEGGGGT